MTQRSRIKVQVAPLEQTAVRVGVVGLGQIGSEVVARLLDDQHVAGTPLSTIQLVAVAARHRRKKRRFAIPDQLWMNDAAALIARRDVDVVVELIGGADGAALDCVERAIKADKAVVTANKALLAKHGLKIAKRADAQRVPVRFEAACLAGLPVIQSMLDFYIGADVRSVAGVMNGTCQFILQAMHQGADMAEALKVAQRLGFAEADPSRDLSGDDAADKLALMSSLAFGTWVKRSLIRPRGIAKLTPLMMRAAETLGKHVQLWAEAHAAQHEVQVWLGPVARPLHSMASWLPDGHNALQVLSTHLGEMWFTGPGAGPAATAQAVLSDIRRIASGGWAPLLGRRVDQLKPVRVVPARLSSSWVVVLPADVVLPKNLVVTQKFFQFDGQHMQAIETIEMIEGKLQQQLKQLRQMRAAFVASMRES